MTADLSLITTEDPGPFSRDQVLTYQDMQAFRTLVFTLRDVLQQRHNNDGTRVGRDAPQISGRYVWDGATKFDLDGGKGPLPTSITPGATGQWTLTFTSPLDTDDFDVQLTGGLTTDLRPVCLGVESHDVNGVTIRAADMANAFANPTRFYISIAYGD